MFRRKRAQKRGERIMLLFINACVRENSRSRRLADHLLARREGPIEEVRLHEIAFPVADESFLERRDRLIEEGRFDDPMFDLARQFAKADEVVIAAPLWDLSFPASLKQYFEQINVTGVTFRYSPEGVPEGLCRAKRLTYVTTAGGNWLPKEFGFGYVEAMARGFYGIGDVKMISAAGLDIDGADVEAILKGAEDAMDQAER
ncbi:MAG: NAD(P)H-dependent oxidoreductase [Oscillospiraceae bacterium]|nr:NAD(P)H-dependent oxidoreductase [Oscillospiraceae bacterium]